MYHYYEALINPKGGTFAGFYGRVIDPATQAVVSIYSDDSGTPISTISGVADMVKTDDSGNASFYVEPGSYHFDIYSTDAATFLFRYADVGMGDGNDVSFLQAGTGAVSTSVAAAVRALGINAVEFGINFDGTNEHVKLQAAIDAAHTHQLPLFLYGNILKIGATIDLRAKYVDIRGAGPNSTAIVASAAMDSMFNVEDASDVVVSPFYLRGLRLDANELADHAVSVRYRHFTVMEDLYVLNALVSAIKEMDAWNNIRRNVVCHGSPIGMHLVGANNSSLWEKCSFATCTDRQLVIENNGTSSGNVGLVFNACDVEFPGVGGAGISVEAGSEAVFNGCYLGEQMEGPIIENSGHVTINGGALFWGYNSDACLFRPLSGRVMVNGAQLNGQTSGNLTTLFGLTNAEVDADANGHVGLRDVAIFASLSPAPILGDVLDIVPGKSYVPNYGQDYTAAAIGDTTVSTSSSGSSKTMTVTAIDADLADRKATMRCDIAPGWRKGKTVYFVLVYQSTKPVQIRLATSPFGSNYSMGEAPAASRKTTYIIATSTPTPDTYPYLELTIDPAAVSDTLTVHKAAFCDYAFVNPGDGNLGNLGLVA